eukprot:scaffold392_cov234-Pinguiococcus_pyrenoidosus.AAC.8
MTQRPRAPQSTNGNCEFASSSLRLLTVSVCARGDERRCRRLWIWEGFRLTGKELLVMYPLGSVGWLVEREREREAR